MASGDSGSIGFEPVRGSSNLPANPNTKHWHDIGALLRRMRNAPLRPGRIKGPDKGGAGTCLEFIYKGESIMTNEEISEKVRKAIAEQLGMAMEDIKPDSVMARDLCVDSLDQVGLVMRVEDDFEIEILDSEMSRLSTVQDWVNLVSEKVGAQNKD